MTSKKTIVIFSHGFGVRKDNIWLFTDLSSELEKIWVESALFDYCLIDDEKRELYVPPFSDQSKTLQEVIDKTHKNNPDAKIVIVAHSQWCIIPPMCDMSYVSAVILLSPFFQTDMKDVLERYSKFPGEIDIDGVSRRERSDGTTTAIPAMYWKERFNTDMVALYNEMATRKDTYIVYALQDQVMKFTEHHRIKNVYMINVDGNHDFNKEFRPMINKVVVDIVKWEIYKLTS